MDTKNFYDNNAEDYYKKTIHAENISNINLFTSLIEPEGFVLDLGCGSGRDSLIFRDKGFLVFPIDYSTGLANVSLKENKLKIYIKDFSKMKNFGDGLWNGIWANASLLHLNKDEFISILPRLYDSLAPKGFLYFSLKPSEEDYKEDIIDGRFFAKYSEKEIKNILYDLGLPIYDFWITKSTIETGQDWFNILIKKQ